MNSVRTTKCLTIKNSFFSLLAHSIIQIVLVIKESVKEGLGYDINRLG